MGVGCENVCGPEHGRQEPMDSGICKCDPCYHGQGCNILCGQFGSCAGNGTCDCTDNVGLNSGYWGEYCNEKNCPGIGKFCLIIISLVII